MTRVTSVFAVVALVTGIVAVHLWQQLRASNELTSQLRERVAQLELQLQGRQLIGLAPGVEGEPQGQAGAAPPGALTAAVPAAAEDSATALARRRMLQPIPAPQQQYPDLEKQLGLRSDEATALYDLLARRAQQAEIEALLGQVRYQQLQEIQREQQQVTLANTRVAELYSKLELTAYPLANGQATQLTATLRAEQMRRNQELSLRTRPTDPRAQVDFDEETLRATEASQARVFAAAQAYLSAEQIAVLRSSMAGTVTNQRASLQSRRAQLDGGGGTAPRVP